MGHRPTNSIANYGFDAEAGFAAGSGAFVCGSTTGAGNNTSGVGPTTGAGGVYGFGGGMLDAGIPVEGVVVGPPFSGIVVVAASCAWHIMKAAKEVKRGIRIMW
jgi:hypothetical protein